MVWLKRRGFNWPMATLALLVIAFIGPWAYDRINVPAQYSCTKPNVRLEGDFCGVPVSGLWILAAVAGVIGAVVRGIADPPTMTELGRELLFGLVTLFLLLPFLSTLVMLVRRDRLGWRIFHVMAWGLAAVSGLWWFRTLLLSGTPPIRLWGLWIYIGLVVAVLALEIAALAGRRRPG